MKILVTGSSGFIGSHFIDKVKGIHEIIRCDLKTGESVSKLTESDVADVDAVVHLAAETSVWNDDLLRIVKHNIADFVHIFLLCKNQNKRFIYASSSCSFNVTSLYGLSKNFDDEFVKLYDYGNVVGLRFHNVYGKNPREDTLLAKCMNEKVVLWNKGENYRHFTYIDDVCRAIEKALTVKNGLYNVCNPEVVSIKTFAKECAKYKPLSITYKEERRALDKDRQNVDETLPDILCGEYVDINYGLWKLFIGN